MPPPKKQTVRRRAAANNAANKTPANKRDAIWQDVARYHANAVRYAKDGEWLGSYFNVCLCEQSCANYVVACGGKLSLLLSEAEAKPAPRVRTVLDVLKIEKKDAPTLLAQLRATLPAYQRKVRTFQQAFGCPADKAANATKKPSTGSNNDEDATDCSDVTSVDLSNPHVREVVFADLVGNELPKQTIEDTMVFPVLMPQLYPHRARALLFYGPPGTGKTLLAKATAFELNRRSDQLHVLFFAPTADAFKGKYVGETEAKIVKLFRCASEHATEKEAALNREAATTTSGKQTKRVLSVLFIDEIDSLARRRDTSGAAASIVASATNTLLQTMDGINAYDNVIVIGATNFPWNIDSAVLRRFGQKVYVPLPSESELVELMQRCVVGELCRALLPVHPSPEKQLVVHAFRERSPTEQFNRLLVLHGLQTSDLEVLASEMTSTRTTAGYSPRDLVRMCDAVFKRAAKHAATHGRFYAVKPHPDRKAHADHTAHLEELLTLLHGLHVSERTFQRLCVQCPHAIQTDVPPVYSDEAGFPRVIVDESDAQALQHTAKGAKAEVVAHRYEELATVKKPPFVVDADIVQRMVADAAKATKAFAEAVGLHFHVYVPDATTTKQLAAPSDTQPYVLYRTVRVYVSQETHNLPLFLFGTLPASCFKSSDKSKKAKHTNTNLTLPTLLKHVTRVRFQFDDQWFDTRVDTSSTLSLRTSNIVADYSRTPLVIDQTDKTWFRALTDALTFSKTPRSSSSTQAESADDDALHQLATRIAKQFVKGTTVSTVTACTGRMRMEHTTSSKSDSHAGAPLQFVHLTYDSQALLDAKHDVQASAKRSNIAALDEYQRTGKEPSP